MQPQPEQELEPYLLAELQPGEAIRYRARATDGTIAVSDRRLLVAASERLALSLPYSELRRIQFDIERGRPAALAFVPELPHHEPVILSIPPEEYRAVGQALIAIAERLFALGGAEPAAIGPTDGPSDGPTDGAPGQASNEDLPA